MAIISTNSQSLNLEQALAIKDVNGKQVKFVRQDDGSYYSEVTTEAKPDKTTDTGKKKAPTFKYTYHVTPRPQLATVVIEKQEVGRNIEREIELKSLGFDPKDPNAPPHIKVRLEQEPAKASESNADEEKKEDNDESNSDETETKRTYTRRK